MLLGTEWITDYEGVLNIFLVLVSIVVVRKKKRESWRGFNVYLGMNAGDETSGLTFLSTSTPCYGDLPAIFIVGVNYSTLR